MKLSISMLASGLLLVGVTEGANAACGDSQIMNAALTSLLSGNTVCVSNGSGGWENQEEHVSGGALVDYKKGPGDNVDPTKQVGTWSVSGTDASTVVNYNYTHGGNSGPFSFTVHSADNVHLSFCDASNNEIVAATLKVGAGACP